MKLIAQFVGGPCDGHEMELEVDGFGYPDGMEVSSPEDGAEITYYRRPIKGMLREKPHVVRDGVGIVYFDDQEQDEEPIEDEEE